MTSRKLPRTTTIVQNENAALKHKVDCLNASLEQSYSDNHKLMEIIKTLKKEKAEVEEILQYREEFIEAHCA